MEGHVIAEAVKSYQYEVLGTHLNKDRSSLEEFLMKYHHCYIYIGGTIAEVWRYVLEFLNRNGGCVQYKKPDHTRSSRFVGLDERKPLSINTFTLFKLQRCQKVCEAAEARLFAHTVGEPLFRSSTRSFLNIVEDSLGSAQWRRRRVFKLYMTIVPKHKDIELTERMEGHLGFRIRIYTRRLRDFNEQNARHSDTTRNAVKAFERRNNVRVAF